MSQSVLCVSRHVKLDTTQGISWQPKGKIINQATYVKERVDGHCRKVRKRKPWATEIAAETACLSPIRCDLSVFPRVAIGPQVKRPMALLGYREVTNPGGSPISPTGACYSLRRNITETYLLYVNEIKG